MTLLNSVLSIDCTKSAVECTSKKRTLELICEIAGEKTGIDTQCIFDNMLAREKLGSTGIGSGIAIPHSRISGLTSAVAVLIQLKEPIAFDAIDKQPVDLLFALIVPEDEAKKHLKTLSAMAEKLNNKPLCRRLRRAQSDEELYNIMLGLECSDNLTEEDTE